MIAPMIGKFVETSEGLTVIRAFRKHDYMHDSFNTISDE